jgi:hypothetical protein
MRFKFAAWLLCFVVIAGTLDTIPDLPALDPHGREAVVLSRIYHHQGPSVRLDSSVSVPSFEPNWFSVWQIVENSVSTFTPTVFPQATDTSPPELL